MSWGDSQKPVFYRLTDSNKNNIIILITTAMDAKMELSKETRDRIFAAADSLYEQTGRETFPTVDAVRKTARVNMNDAHTGMKAWRRAQTAQAAPVAVQVPEIVQQASHAALIALWQQAQELANESLRAAQAGWDAERVEADTLNKQMADAYEAQAAELKTAQTHIAEQEATAHKAAQHAEQQRQMIEEVRTALINLEQKVATAEARAYELRLELDHAHREAHQLRTERDQAQEKATAHADHVQVLQSELAKVQAKSEAEHHAHQEQKKMAAAEAHRQAERLAAVKAERDVARKEANQAREDAATLRGQLQALQTVMPKKKTKDDGTA